MTTIPSATAASAGAPAGASESAGNPNSILGQNDFLKLMIAQMQAQNPLEPGNSNEFLNELAQMTQVEQITNLANATELTGGVQLIGRTVTYNGSSGPLTGKVQSTQSSASGVTLTVEGVPGITLTSVTNVE